MINGGREFGIKEFNNYAKLIGMNVLYITFYTFKQNRTPKHINGIILGIAKLIIIKEILLKYL